MSPFEEFSVQVEKITKLHPLSRLIRAVCRVEYWWRKHIQNRPLPFTWVDEVEGKPVGEPIDIYHLRLHDMMEHEARGVMTGKVLLEGLRTNAFSVVCSEGIDLQGKTTIQPRWV